MFAITLFSWLFTKRIYEPINDITTATNFQCRQCVLFCVGAEPYVCDCHDKIQQDVSLLFTVPLFSFWIVLLWKFKWYRYLHLPLCLLIPEIFDVPFPELESSQIFADARENVQGAKSILADSRKKRVNLVCNNE